MQEATPETHAGTEHATPQHEDAGESQRASEGVLHATARRYQEVLNWADPDSIETTLALLRAQRMHRMAAGRAFESMELGIGMTGARFTLLLTLYFSRDNLLAQNEISRELSVSRTNITNLIDGLERDGLVARVPNPADRRVSYAKLTDAGEELCVKLLPTMTKLMLDSLDGFSQEEKLQFKEYLYRLQRNIIAQHPGRYGKGIAIDG